MKMTTDGLSNQNMQTLPEQFICDLSDYGLIAVSGIDSEKFLQGQLSCDIREITDTISRLGAYCNPKGRILALLRLFKLEGTYYLSLPKSLLEPTLQQLKKYVLFSKVTLTDASAQWLHWGYTGTGYAIPDNIDEISINENCIIIRTPHSQPAAEIFVKPDAAKILWQQFTQQVTLAGNDAWRLFNIRSGIPAIYPATVEQFTPHMINLPALHGVSFNKGCYVGQEIIARTQYLGRAKRHLRTATLTSQQQPQPGDLLYTEQNQEAGIIVDAAALDQHHEILAVLHENALENTIHWQNGTGPVVSLN